jgi:hypothetical protein
MSLKGRHRRSRQWAESGHLLPFADVSNQVDRCGAQEAIPQQRRHHAKHRATQSRPIAQRSCDTSSGNSDYALRLPPCRRLDPPDAGLFQLLCVRRGSSRRISKRFSTSSINNKHGANESACWSAAIRRPVHFQWNGPHSFTGACDISHFQIPRTHMACAVATQEATSPTTQIMLKIIVFLRSTSPAGALNAGGPGRWFRELVSWFDRSGMSCMIRAASVNHYPFSGLRGWDPGARRRSVKKNRTVRPAGPEVETERCCRAPQTSRASIDPRRYWPCANRPTSGPRSLKSSLWASSAR